jgi:hypothetical protein
MIMRACLPGTTVNINITIGIAHNTYMGTATPPPSTSYS